MKTIERYVFGAFISSFVLAFLVLSFVLTIGLLVQIVGYIMDGVPMSVVGEFCMVSLPETLQWSIPLALLVSSILVFSRMSADSEIAAVRSCGIHLMTIMKWPLAFALLCTLLGFYINNEIVPRGHQIRRTLKARVSVDTGLSVLEPGRVITDFPDVKLYFGSKKGNWLNDVIALDYSHPGIDRLITAENALVVQNGADINLELYRMTVDPLDEKHRTMARFNRFVYTIKDVLKTGSYRPGTKDFRLKDLVKAIKAGEAEVEKAGADCEKGSRGYFARCDLSVKRVELNKRFVFAMASICFVLVGIPLGIRSHRRESSIGMAISLAVALGYYVVIILTISLQKDFWTHPEYIVWLPVLLCFALSAVLVRRHL